MAVMVDLLKEAQKAAEQWDEKLSWVSVVPWMTLLYLSKEYRVYKNSKRVSGILWKGFYFKNSVGYWYSFSPRFARLKRITRAAEEQRLNQLCEEVYVYGRPTSRLD